MPTFTISSRISTSQTFRYACPRDFAPCTPRYPEQPNYLASRHQPFKFVCRPDWSCRSPRSHRLAAYRDGSLLHAGPLSLYIHIRWWPNRHSCGHGGTYTTKPRVNFEPRSTRGLSSAFVVRDEAQILSPDDYEGEPEKNDCVCNALQRRADSFAVLRSQILER